MKNHGSLIKILIERKPQTDFQIRMEREMKMDLEHWEERRKENKKRKGVKE